MEISFLFPILSIKESIFSTLRPMPIKMDEPSEPPPPKTGMDTRGGLNFILAGFINGMPMVKDIEEVSGRKERTYD